MRSPAVTTSSTGAPRRSKSSTRRARSSPSARRAPSRTLHGIEGLERDLEEREHKITELRATIEELRADLEAEYELRERLAEPANRLRAGIDMFNDSDQRRSMNSLSRTLGQPEVHVNLDDGEEPPVLLTFTWQGVTWQTHAANPGLAVEDPRVYLKRARVRTSPAWTESRRTPASDPADGCCLGYKATGFSRTVQG